MRELRTRMLNQTGTSLRNPNQTMFFAALANQSCTAECLIPNLARLPQAVSFIKSEVEFFKVLNV
jgi:hypothetical protein